MPTLGFALKGDFIEETPDDVFRKRQRVHVLEAVLAAKAYEPTLLQGGIPVGQRAADQLVILHIVIELKENFDGDGVVSVAD